MSSAEFAASNIANLPSYSKSRSANDGQGANSSTAYGPGDGPGGAQLYDPDWFREPTSAELGGYLTANMPREGWGLIACQTIARNRVDNCRTLGEYPLGSGFGRAVREAAWQFQVLPPRINGRPVIGAWVRIRISYGVVNTAS
jgi:protein TonB